MNNTPKRFKKLYIEILKNKDKPETIKKLLEEYYFNTGNSGFCAKPTYHNKECTKLHCGNGRYRSFDNLLSLVNTYCPDTSPEKLMHELLTLKKAIGTGSSIVHITFNFSNCGVIQKTTLTSNYIYNNRRYISYSYIINNPKYKSKYSWKELLNKLNITNQQELDKYINKYKD